MWHYDKQRRTNGMLAAFFLHGMRSNSDFVSILLAYRAVLEYIEICFLQLLLRGIALLRPWISRRTSRHTVTGAARLPHWSPSKTDGPSQLASLQLLLD